MQRERFYNLYDDGGHGFSYSSRDEADAAAADGRVALIRVRPK